MSEDKTVQPRIKYGVLVGAAFALELGRLHGKDYTDPNVVRPAYITRPDLTRIGIENGSNAHVNYVLDHPNTRPAWVTDDMLADEGTRTSYSRFNVKLGVPGKATQKTASRDPNGPRLRDGTPQYKMDIFFADLDNVLANMPREQFDLESQRVVMPSGE